MEGMLVVVIFKYWYNTTHNKYRKYDVTNDVSHVLSHV